MPPVGFEPTISAGELSQTYALDRAATGTGRFGITFDIICSFYNIRCSNELLSILLFVVFICLLVCVYFIRVLFIVI